MNIAFDATAILGPMSKNRGIGNYALSQFRTMISQDRTNQYFLFNIFEPFSLGEYSNLKEEYFDCGKDFGLAKVENSTVLSGLIRKFIQRNKIDVFYITSPFEDHIPTYEKEWFDGVKTVVTVYDIIPYIFKNHYFKPDGKIPSWYMDRIAAIQWADKVLVISQSVKDDLIKHLNMKGENIDVIWGAPGEMFREIDVDLSQRNKLQNKFHLNDNFIMCTGGDDERKNIDGLIKAYGKLPTDTINKYDLAIVCKLQKESILRYKDLAASLGVGNHVIMTNFVSNEELLQLYNMSSLVAFPSKYEGFGLPVTEAWACGKPVLTADNSSLCQIAGDAAVLVNANDIDDISRGLKLALSDDMLAIMAEKGKKRLEKFRWPVVAETAIEAINQFGKEPDLKHTMPRLAFFSPVPPQESGIADYSADIIHAIANDFLIDVYIDDGIEPDAVLPDNINVLNHHSFSQNADNYDYLLFQMGNSVYHYYMYPYIKRYGGILVLHDYNMHGVARHISEAILKDNHKTYIEYLKEDLPIEEVIKIWNGFKEGREPDRQLEINGFVTNYADKIIVHSSYAKESLLRKNIGRTVDLIPHYAKIEPLEDPKVAKKKLNIDPEKTVIAFFGHITDTKRSVPLLKAASKYLRENSSCEMYFVGKLDNAIADEFNNIIKRSEVSDRIIITGYTDIEDFCKYIDAADICFNLRYPYNGENSGTLCRILAKGKSVVVNRIGSFQEVPDACCLKLPSVEDMTEEEEIDAIYNALKRLVEEPQLRDKIGMAARKYAKEVLSLDIIGQKYADSIISTYTNPISERVLDSIKQTEIEKKKYSYRELCGVAKTIAYCIE